MFGIRNRNKCVSFGKISPMPNVNLADPKLWNIGVRTTFMSSIVFSGAELPALFLGKRLSHM